MDLFEKVESLRTECDEHGQRLRARAAAVRATGGPGSELFAEVMEELVSTGLEFTKEAFECVALVAEEVGDSDGLTPEEVDTLRRPLASYLEMLDALIGAQGELPTPQKKGLQEKRDECVAALALLDELSAADEGDAAAGDDEGEDEEGDEGDANN